MKSVRPKVRIGVIGCGRVAREHHLPSLKRIPSAEVAACFDPDKDRMTGLAGNFSIPRCCDSAASLLHDPEIDAVCILTPTPSHRDLGLAALEAGKHLFMEKPLALTREDCLLLAEKSRKTDRKTMVCFNLRWHRLIRQAERLITSGLVGEIKAVQSLYSHYRDGGKAPDWHRRLSLGGGVTFNESIHHFDLWRFLLKQEVEDVSAIHTSSEHYEDETSIINARLSGGAFATAVNTFRTGPANELEILGTEGRLVVNLYRFDGLKFYPKSSYPGSASARIQDVVRFLGNLGSALTGISRGGGFAETFVLAWHHFLDAILEDRGTQCTFEDGAAAVLTALAAIESFTCERRVAVNKGR
jgi:predicted dehydrogenase